MQSIKVRIGRQVRRDSLAVDTLNFAGLTAVITELFGTGPLPIEGLRYLDDEAEWVNLSSDRELREALRIVEGKTLEILCPARFLPGFRGQQEGQNHGSPQCPRRDFEHQESPHGLHHGPHGHGPHGHGPRHGPHGHGPNHGLHHGPHGHGPHHGPHGHGPHHGPHGHGPRHGPHGHGPHHGQVPHFPHHDRRWFGANKPESGPFRHPANCDSCNNQIVGNRFKCNDCPDYDLCDPCFAKSSEVHPGHTFTTLARSFPRWHHRRAEHCPDQKQFHAARCDSCRARIVGVRHRCLNCPDFDLCSSCVPKKDDVHPAEHVFAEISDSRAPLPSMEQPKEETKEEGKEANEEATKEEIQEEAQEKTQDVSAIEEAKPVEEAQEPAAAPQLSREALLNGTKMLEAMGFSDRANNIRVMVEFGGDVTAAVAYLLNEN